MKDTPNYIIKSNYLLLEEEPLLGALVMKTARGGMTLGMTRETAEELSAHLLRFLEGKKSMGQENR